MLQDSYQYLQSARVFVGCAILIAIQGNMELTKRL